VSSPDSKQLRSGARGWLKSQVPQTGIRGKYPGLALQKQRRERNVPVSEEQRGGAESTQTTWVLRPAVVPQSPESKWFCHLVTCHFVLWVLIHKGF
jgi:hypothetical protein